MKQPASKSTTLTIRIDRGLKRDLEAAARLADQSVTDFVARSVKQRIAKQCPRCGRDGECSPPFRHANTRRARRVREPIAGGGVNAFDLGTSTEDV